MLDWFLDDQYSHPEDNQSMTHRAKVGGVYLGYICLDHKRRGGNQIHTDPACGVSHIGIFPRNRFGQHRNNSVAEDERRGGGRLPALSLVVGHIKC